MITVSLLGVPNDDNSSLLKGPAEAPAAIRREWQADVQSSWSETGFDLRAPERLTDRGDVTFSTAIDPWDAIEHDVDRLVALKAPVLCLGGDHAITHPIMRAVRRHHRKLTILHVDAHPDIYHAYQGNLRSHTSPFARIMEEGLCDRLIQVGLRTVNDHHRDQFKRFGVEVVPMGEWRPGLRFDIDTPVYLTIDIDGLDPAFAPGVSHREPGGPSPRQVIDLIHTVGQPIVAGDLVEYNPGCDIGNQTASVAVKLMKEMAGMMLKTHAG